MPSVEYNAFNRAVKHAISAVKKSTLPIHEHLLFSFSEGKLQVTGANAEFQITAPCEASANSSLSFCVSAERIRRISATDGVVDVRVTDSRAVFKTNLGRYQVATLPAEDYPLMVSATGISMLFPTNLISSVLHASAERDVRYYLNGVHVRSSGDGKVTAEASDGHRAARQSAAIDGTQAFEAIVPREAAKVISSLGNCSAVFAPNQATFSGNEITVVTKLTDGRFPDLDRVFPKHPNQITFSREKAVAAIRAIIGCSGENGGVHLTISGQTMRLVAKNHEDEAESDFPVQGVDGLQSGVNIAYLLAAIESQAETVRLDWLNDSSSVLLSGSELTEVIMPMRV